MIRRVLSFGRPVIPVRVAVCLRQFAILCLAVSCHAVTLSQAYAFDNAQASGSVQQKAVLERKLVGEIGFRSGTYDVLKTRYGYDFLYPQALAVDVREKEFFVLRGARTGKNRWGWIEVYDLESMRLKTTFSTSQQWREGLIVKRESGRRYLYTLGDSAVIRFDITVLPANLSAQKAERQFARGFSMIAAHNDGFLVQERRGMEGPFGPQQFTRYDAAFNRTGSLMIALSDEVASSLPGRRAKLQAIASNGEFVYAGYGAAFVPRVGKDISGMAQGTVVLDVGGTIHATSLVAPGRLIDWLSPALGYTPTCIENEGMSAAGGHVYSLWVTLGPRERESQAFSRQGIVVLREPATAGQHHSSACCKTEK